MPNMIREDYVGRLKQPDRFEQLTAKFEIGYFQLSELYEPVESEISEITSHWEYQKWANEFISTFPEDEIEKIMFERLLDLIVRVLIQTRYVREMERKKL